jgi:hypothetical protein
MLIRKRLGSGDEITVRPQPTEPARPAQLAVFAEAHQPYLDNVEAGSPEG